MSEEVKDTQGTGFSKEYVSGLREEAASWRVKYQELKQEVVTTGVQQELTSRGVQAEASWVDFDPSKENAAEAVDRFLSKYEHLKPVATEEVKPASPSMPKVMNPGGSSNSNLTGDSPSSSLKGRSLSEIQKDPKARSLLRDHYRALTRAQSHQKDNF